jgi:hypothetical protein
MQQNSASIHTPCQFNPAGIEAHMGFLTQKRGINDGSNIVALFWCCAQQDVNVADVTRRCYLFRLTGRATARLQSGLAICFVYFTV